MGGQADLSYLPISYIPISFHSLKDAFDQTSEFRRRGV